MSYLSLTDADREAMLAAIGVSSVDELFRDIPAGVRFERRARPRAGALRAGARRAPRGARRAERRHRRASSRSSAPASTTTTCRRSSTRSSQRGEFLTAYTPYQPEMSQGVLQAIFEYQTAICELTGHGRLERVRLRRHDGRRRRLLHREARDRPLEGRPHRGAEPAGAPGREDVRARLRPRGRRGAAPRTARPTRTSSREAADDAACVIFQQPNFFGCLEPAPDLAAAANDAGALPVAHVDPISLGVLEAPGRYGCAIAIGEGQGAGNYQSYGGPHYGFLAARSEFIRRMPGRIVGETTDADGRARLCPDPADPRAAHPPREGDLEHHDEPDAARARRARPPLVARARRGCARWGRPAWPRRVREGAARASSSCFQTRQRSRSLPSASDGPREEVDPRRRARTASTPATRSAATTRGWTTRCSSRSPRSARRPTSTASPRCSARVKLIYEKSQAGPPRAARSPRHDLPRAGGPRRAPPRRAAAPARARRARARPPLHRALDAQLRDRHRLLPARLLHDEAQPARQRAGRRAARASATSIRSRRRTARRARSS